MNRLNFFFAESSYTARNITSRTNDFLPQFQFITNVRYFVTGKANAFHKIKTFGSKKVYSISFPQE